MVVLVRFGQLLPRPSLPSLAEWRRNAIAWPVVWSSRPPAIALAVAVGVPPIAGLYTAAFAGGLASLCGGSRFNITDRRRRSCRCSRGRCCSTGRVRCRWWGCSRGVLLLVMSSLGAGRLVRFIPHPVIIGFTAGIALSIAFGQLNTFLAVTGTDPHREHFHEKLWDTLAHLETVGAVTPLMGVAALVLLFAWQRFVPRRARPLVAVTGFTALTWWLGLDTPTLGSRYGELPRDFPMPTFALFDAGSPSTSPSSP
ncbi:MAG: SulP family inorganic anion transporter [Dehalococcoidia bacterium]